MNNNNPSYDLLSPSCSNEAAHNPESNHTSRMSDPFVVWNGDFMTCREDNEDEDCRVLLDNDDSNSSNDNDNNYYAEVVTVVPNQQAAIVLIKGQQQQQAVVLLPTRKQRPSVVVKRKSPRLVFCSGNNQRKRRFPRRNSQTPAMMIAALSGGGCCGTSGDSGRTNVQNFLWSSPEPENALQLNGSQLHSNHLHPCRPPSSQRIIFTTNQKDNIESELIETFNHSANVSSTQRLEDT